MLSFVKLLAPPSPHLSSSNIQHATNPPAVDAAIWIGIVATVVIAAQIVMAAWLIKRWPLRQATAVVVAAAATILVVVVEAMIACSLMKGVVQ